MSEWGVVAGKFWPPHEGHLLLVRTALEQCSHVTVMVISRPDQQPPSAEQRRDWLQDLCPAAEVVIVPDIGYDDDSEAWARYTVERLGGAPDAVFSSESYGPHYARFLGARHVSVDPSRRAVPCSGTSVRADPFHEWDHLPAPVRAFYAFRVCTVGAESTGTTTLAQDLARHLHTAWVPEYGRDYSVEKAARADPEWRSEEFVHIAQEQARAEDAAARVCNRILVCDTDAFATALWHERYLGHRSAETEAVSDGRRTAGTEIDLYLLTDADIPFVQDGTRDGEHIRDWMHGLFIERLEESGRQYVLVSGSPGERLETAVMALRGRVPSALV